MRRTLWLGALGLLVLLIIALSNGLALSAQPLDYDIPNGHFFTQTNGFPPGTNPTGYSVTDEGGVPFWQEFKRLGGVPGVGYPMSRRFLWDGFVSQVMQKGVFQWRPEAKEAWFINVFDEMHDAGKDPWLLTFRSVPAPLGGEFDAGKSWEQIVRDRIALLDARPAIKQVYLAAASPLTLYGLPTSRVVDMGNHYVVRLQRAVIQQWKVETPWAKAGQVTVANGGAVVVEAGMFAPQVTTPEWPPGMATPTPTVTPTPQPMPTPAYFYSQLGAVRYEPNETNIWVEGMIYNLDGTPRNGVRVLVTHQYGWTTVSKPSGPAEQPGRPDGFWAVILIAGRENFRDDVWYAQVLEDGAAASPAVAFSTQREVGPNSRQRVFIDWKRNQ